MLVKSKSGKLYDPIKNVKHNNKLISILRNEIENSNDSEFIEFLQKEIDKRKSLNGAALNYFRK